MSEKETQIRKNLVYQIAPALGNKLPNIVRIIHHSSTRKAEGATEDSDIDLTLVFDDNVFVFTNVGKELVRSEAAVVLEDFQLEIGTGPMQVHLNMSSIEILENPQKFISNEDGEEILQEILARGEVVYERDNVITLGSE